MILLTKISAIFFLIGLVSMLTHGVKKWTMGEIRGSLIDWYRLQPKATVGAILACLSGIATAILSGALTDYTVGAQILAAWGIGYSADTLNNQERRDDPRV